MSVNSDRVINWRKRTKQRIIQSFGGKCGICDYNRCDEALDLHHLDPNEKEFSLASVRAWPKSWEKIVIELRKCCLLCCRCHREYHSGLTQVPTTIQRFDETFADYKILEKLDRECQHRKNCPVCNKDMFNRSKTCSLKCAAKLAHKYDWDSIDLFDLYVTKRFSKSKIARIVGCTDGAVFKRLKKLSII